MARLRISELARAGGVSVETVRFYQRKGLLSRPRGMGEAGVGIRHYGREDVQQLSFIKSAQAAGFTLKEIARLLELEGSDDRSEVRALAWARVAALDVEIATLTRARNALERLAGECERTLTGPCPILNAFETSA